MKIGLWFATLSIALAITSCSINHRSGDFACQIQSDCSSDRTCVDGFCVESSSTLDGGLPGSDGSPGDASPVCPTQCTSCDLGQNSCLIDCSVNPDICNQPIVCPKGFDCNVMCSRADRCQQGITCDGANSCTITCTGQNSCNGIQCGAGACNVTCTGRGSCTNVTCGPSCGCAVDCAFGACTGVMCPPAAQCTGQFGSCTADTPACNTCQ